MFPTINLGPLSIPTPEFILMLGFWLRYVLAERNAKRFQIDPHLLEKGLWICLLAGLVGARLSYVARASSAFQGNLLSIFSLNTNLLDPIGGLLISAAVGFLYVSNQRISLWVFLDSLSPFFAVLSVALSLSDLASGTGFGIPTTLPWGLSLWGELRHPVQIYYFISGFIALGVILTVKQTDKYQAGFVFLLFISLTTGFRLFFSGFQESAILFPGGIRPLQLVYWTILAISLFILRKQNLQTRMEKSDEPKG